MTGSKTPLDVSLGCPVLKLRLNVGELKNAKINGYVKLRIQFMVSWVIKY